MELGSGREAGRGQVRPSPLGVRVRKEARRFGPRELQNV